MDLFTRFNEINPPKIDNQLYNNFTKKLYIKNNSYDANEIKEEELMLYIKISFLPATL